MLLEKLKAAASGTENLMPLFIECVENDITLGEICNTLRVVWGEYVAEGFYGLDLVHWLVYNDLEVYDDYL